MRALTVPAREVPLLVRPAAEALRRGDPILLYDAPEREGETDLVILAEEATPELVRTLRRDAGGLACVAISSELQLRLGLPYAVDLLALGGERYPITAELARERPRYDRRSAFGIWVNHRSTFTGIPDNDRARTIRGVGELARDAPQLSDAALRARFVADFASPGHVPLLYAAPGLLRERKGHTELSISLARMARLTESTAVCEMLGDSGGARSPETARRYAREHGWPFLEGMELREAWDRWSG